MARSARRGAAPGGLGLLRTVEKTGLRKGVNGSKTWFYVGTGLWTMRTIRRMAERKEEILISETLKPGQRIVISNGRATIDDGPAVDLSAPKGRRGRKAQRKADAKAAKKAAKRSAKAAKRASAPAAS